jgi:hypothetical protein
MDPEFTFERDAAQVVTRAKRPVGRNQHFRHGEQRDAPQAGWRVGRSCQDEVDDVLREIVIAVGDEDFLATDPEMIALGHGARPDKGQVRTGLWLGQVHRAGPGSRDQLAEEQAMQGFVAGPEEEFGGGAGQHRA